MCPSAALGTFGHTAILDLLLSRRVAAPADVHRGRMLLVRIVQMLSKRIARRAAPAPAGP